MSEKPNRYADMVSLTTDEAIMLLNTLRQIRSVKNGELDKLIALLAQRLRQSQID